MLYILDLFKFYLKKRKLLFIGNNTKFSGDIYFKNPQYIRLGDNCYIGPECKIEAWDHYGEDRFNPQIILDSNVRINSKCHIGAIRKVVIGSGTLIGSNVMIIDHSHGKSVLGEMKRPPAERELYSKGSVEIGENCWICENVCILPNVHIGRGSIIGAGAIVTKDIPPYSVVGGNPAKVVKSINYNENKLS